MVANGPREGIIAQAAEEPQEEGEAHAQAAKAGNKDFDGEQAKAGGHHAHEVKVQAQGPRGKGADLSWYFGRGLSSNSMMSKKEFDQALRRSRFG